MRPPEKVQARAYLTYPDSANGRNVSRPSLLMRVLPAAANHQSSTATDHVAKIQAGDKIRVRCRTCCVQSY
jgi:hypothetical protein